MDRRDAGAPEHGDNQEDADDCYLESMIHVKLQKFTIERRKHGMKKVERGITIKIKIKPNRNIRRPSPRLLEYGVLLFCKQ